MNIKQTELIQNAQISILSADFVTIKDSVSATLDACHKAKIFAGMTKSIDVLYTIFPTLPKGITAPKLPADTDDYKQDEMSTIRYCYQSIIRQWCLDVGIVANKQARAPNKNPPKESVKANKSAKANKSLNAESAPVAPVAPVTNVTDALPIGASLRDKTDAIIRALKGLRKDVEHSPANTALISDALALLDGIKI